MCLHGESNHFTLWRHRGGKKERKGKETVCFWKAGSLITVPWVKALRQKAFILVYRLRSQSQSTTEGKSWRSLRQLVTLHPLSGSRQCSARGVLLYKWSWSPSQRMESPTVGGSSTLIRRIKTILMFDKRTYLSPRWFLISSSGQLRLVIHHRGTTVPAPWLLLCFLWQLMYFPPFII